MSNAIFAGINGVAVGFNAAALLFLQRDETWFMWLGIVVCGVLMLGSMVQARSEKASPHGGRI